MTGPETGLGAGQDGERLVTHERALKACAAWAAHRRARRHATHLQLMQTALDAVAPDITGAADQRWTTELTAQADRYASVGTEIASAMAEALRTAVRIMHGG